MSTLRRQQIGTFNLGDISDVTIGTPVVDQVLKYNGSGWIPGSQTTASAGNGVDFYLDDTHIIPSSSENAFEVNSLTTTPITTTEVLNAKTITNTTAVIEAYLFNTALGRTQLDAGVWWLSTYAKIDSVAGVGAAEVITTVLNVVPDAVNTITITGGSGTSRTATASGGTPFASGDANADQTLSGYLQTPKGAYQITGYTSPTVVTIAVPAAYVDETAVAFSVWKYAFAMTTGNILATALALYEPNFVEALVSTGLANKLAVMYFAKSTYVVAKTITFSHNGTAHYSHFHTPLVTLHDSLAGLYSTSATENYGHVGYGAQTFYGAKTFNSAPILSTTGAGGEILYTNVGGSKAIEGSTALMFSGTGIILATAAPYLKASDTAGAQQSGVVWGATGDNYGYIYHTTAATATLASILDIDAKPSSVSYDSLIRYGYNTTALHKQHAFYTTTGAVQFTDDAVLITATTAPYLSICATGTGAQALYLSQVGSTGNLYYQAVTTGNSILYIDAKVADASATSRMLFGYNSSLAISRTYEFYNGLLSQIIAGSSGNVSEAFRISNNASGTTGTGSSLTFYQAASNAVLYAAGGINVLTEVSWTSTASTRDSRMLLQVSLDGAVGTALTLASSKYATFASGVSSQGFRAEANTGIPTTGSGLEVQYTGGVGYLAAYNRTGTTPLVLNLMGSTVYIANTTWNSNEWTFTSTLLTGAKASFTQSSSTGATEVMILTQADESEGFINFAGSARGAITLPAASAESFRVELNGFIYRIALFADA